MEQEMDMWTAIRHMRELTEKGECFSIVYMSIDQQRQKSSGPVRVNRALLRPQTPTNQNKYADHMLNYLDKDLNLPRQFYQPMLMEFNGLKINPE